MYLVIDKETQNILWENRAPLYQKLKDKQVWCDYDPALHKIIETDTIPQYPVIEKGKLRNMTLEEHKTVGILKLTENEKIEDNQIKYKTIDELIQDGIISLEEIKEKKKSEIKQQYFDTILNTWLEEQLKDTDYDAVCQSIDSAKSIDDLNNI